MTAIDYRAAGVNIDAGNQAVQRIKHQVESTFSPAVLNGLGGFGALYDLGDVLRRYKNPVLVQSIDGVGTKIMVARRMNRYDTIGIDLVSATVNDIVVLGAEPLTLLDYIANDRLQPEIIADILDGMVRACRENDISLVGGEMAEMPGTYAAGEHDLVGVITGVVEKDRIINGASIQPGDVVLVFHSSGLHTNGYSLARKLCFDVGGLEVDSPVPGSKQSLGEILLAPHINYTRPVRALLQAGVPVKGMAHITGGGLTENIPRILPSGCAVEINLQSWPSQPIFDLLRRLGRLDSHEMVRTFNMGAGFVMIVPQEAVAQAKAALQSLPEFPLYEAGCVVAAEKSDKTVRLVGS